MTLYVVKAKVVKVPVGAASGNSIAHIIRAGGIVPEGVDQARLEHLLERGLIAPLVEEQEAALVEIPEGDPTDRWTVKQLRAYAEREGRDLGDASLKADVLAALGITAGDSGD